MSDHKRQIAVALADTAAVLRRVELWSYADEHPSVILRDLVDEARQVRRNHSAAICHAELQA